MEEAKVVYNGIVLAVAFIILKLCGIIEWSWVWVLCPIWIPFVIAFVLLFIIRIVVFSRK